MSSTSDRTTANEQAGIVCVPSTRPFAQTVERLRGAFAAHGITLFATVDHQAAAARVGLVMQPATLLIFGKPEAGTPLMVARPSVALDLPSKVLVTTDAGAACGCASIARATWPSATSSAPIWPPGWRRWSNCCARRLPNSQARQRHSAGPISSATVPTPSISPARRSPGCTGPTPLGVPV